PDCLGEGSNPVANDNADEGFVSAVGCETCKGSGEVPSAEEMAIHDFDNMPATLGEYCSLQEIADYMEFIEEVEETGAEDPAELASAMIENWHSVEYAKGELENYMGTYSSFREYADDAADAMI